MSITVSQLVQKIVIEGADKGKSDLQGMNQAAKETSGGFKSMLGNALSFAAGQAIFNVAGQAMNFLKDQTADMFKVTMEHQDVLKQTADVIKSTGDASGMSAKQIGDLATSLEKSKVFSRDATQEGENLLLTFQHIGSTVIPQATSVMLDMSKAMGQDVKSSAIQMGKALDDPEKGITALTRVGVTFSQQQKDQIKTMQEAGNMAGAQKIILAELSKEFGGSADAGKTLSGQMALLTNKFTDVKQNLGTALMPSLLGMVGWVNSAAMPILSKFSDWFINSAIPGIQKFGGEVGSAFNYIGNVLKTVPLTQLENAWHNITEVFDYSIRHIDVLVKSILSPTLKLIKTDADPVADVIQNLAKGALSTLSGLLQDVARGFMSVAYQLQSGKGPLIDFMNGLKPLTDACKNLFALQWDQFKTVLSDVGKDAKQLGDWFKSSVAPALKDAAPGFASLGVALLNVGAAFIQIRGVIIDVIQHAFEKFAPIIEKIVPPLIRFAGIVAKDLSDGIKFVTPYILDMAKAIGKFADEIIDRVAPIVKGWIDGLTPLIKMFADNWNHTWPMMAGVLKGVWEMIAGIVQIAWAIVSGIIKIGLDIMSGNWKQAWTDLKDMLSGVWEGIKTYLGGAFDAVKSMFTTIWANLSPEMKKPFQEAWDFISGIFDNIKKAIANLTGQGGTVSANTAQIMTGIHHFASGIENFGGGLAYVHAGEILTYLPKGSSVIPASNVPSFLGSGSGNQSGNQNLTVQVFMGTRDITDIVQTKTLKGTRQGGPLRSNL